MQQKITVNTQSSIRMEGKQILRFDPLGIEQACNDADIVFITHAHYDHLSPEDLAKVMKEDTIVVVPASMKEVVTEKTALRENQIVFVNPGDQMEIKGLPVEVIPAYNPAKKFHPVTNQWVGYVVTVDDERYYVSGDTDVTPENRKVKCDIALLPIGGTYTMTFEEAADLVAEIKPAEVIPTHYGTIIGEPGFGESFKALVAKKAPEVQVELRLFQ